MSSLAAAQRAAIIPICAIVFLLCRLPFALSVSPMRLTITNEADQIVSVDVSSESLAGLPISLCQC